MRLVSYLVAYTLLSTGGLLVLRRALDESRVPAESFVERLLTPGVVVGGVLYGASFAIWLLALGRYPVTSIYPTFIGASVVGVALGGWIVLDERLGAAQLVGALAVLSGIALLTR
jgi:multidrug transporter EmrE-like cation transporter